MNIYLDTNILYSDPFFKSNFSDLLIKSAYDKRIKILIPRICLNELFFKLTDKAKLLGNEVSNKIGELNRWTSLDIATPDIDLKKFVDKIKLFYKRKH